MNMKEYNNENNQILGRTQKRKPHDHVGRLVSEFKPLCASGSPVLANLVD
jgi:hypothetical protein